MKDVSKNANSLIRLFPYGLLKKKEDSSYLYDTHNILICY